MRRWIALGALLACMFVAACAGGATTGATSTSGPGVTPTDATTPAAGDTPTTTAMTTPTTTTTGLGTLPLRSITASAANSACPGFAQPGDTLQQMGAIAIDSTGNIALDYPGYRLPDDLPTNAPYTTVNPTHPTGTAVNPDLGIGYTVKLCNLSSSATATLQGVGLQIASQAPISGTTQKDIGAGNCATFFQLPKAITGGGCGGSVGPLEGFTATWPGVVSPGTKVTTAMTNAIPSDLAGPKEAFGPLPISIKPGYTLSMFVGMTSYPALDGTYTFGFGMQFSGFATTYATIQTPPVLLLAHAHQWDGQYCSGATALIAKMTAGKYYFCPKP